MAEGAVTARPALPGRALLAIGIALGLLAVGAAPARCEDAPHLPPAAQVGAIHRDAHGRIVADPAQAAPVAPAATPIAPAVPRRSPAPASAAPRNAATPPPPPSTRAEQASRPPAEHVAATTPDQLDDASCRAYAWQPGMTLDGCRRALKAARERAARGKAAKSE